MRTATLILLGLLALLLSAAPAPAHPGAHASAAGLPGDVLPDLDQMTPDDLMVKRLKVGSRTVFRLGFASAAANVGAGPLTLYGHRPTRQVSTMDVDQLVDQLTGAPRIVQDVGRMSYVVHPDHDHWHLLGFERYELRAPGDDRTLFADRKTGFCLGDRFPIPRAEDLAAFDAVPAQGDTCGLGRPGLTGLFAGISVGWADRYEAQIEGQYIDITKAPSRKYVLVHSLNTEGRIVESDYSNNASSVLFSLKWTGGRDRRPRITVLRRCPRSASCPG